jgi:WD40 repeat protein
MSLILRAEIPDAHPKSILSIAFNHPKIYFGSEDGSITVWDSESQKLLNTFRDHAGWVTGMIYWFQLSLPA